MFNITKTFPPTDLQKLVEGAPEKRAPPYIFCDNKNIPINSRKKRKTSKKASKYFNSFFLKKYHQFGSCFSHFEKFIPKLRECSKQVFLCEGPSCWKFCFKFGSSFVTDSKMGSCGQTDAPTTF
jgi:hypothetical protein